MLHKEDRRVQRTRGILLESLTELMMEQGYDEITVQHIIDRANVGRSTFYSHFEDKDELLKANIDQLRSFVIQQRSMQQSTAAADEPFRFGFSLPMLQHVLSHKRIYKKTFGQQSGVIVIHHMRLMLAELVREDIDAYLALTEKMPVPTEIAAEFALNTFFTLISWWMGQTNRYSSKEVDDLFHHLVLKGFGSEQCTPNKD